MQAKFVRLTAISLGAVQELQSVPRFDFQNRDQVQAQAGARSVGLAAELHEVLGLGLALQALLLHCGPERLAQAPRLVQPFVQAVSNQAVHTYFRHKLDRHL
jgi:hypothetical protein